MPLLTPEQVQEELAMPTRRVVIDLLRTGELAGLKIARKWRVRSEDLVAYQNAALAAARAGKRVGRSAAPIQTRVRAPRHRRRPGDAELALPGAAHFLPKK